MTYRTWIPTVVQPWLRRTWGARLAYIPSLLSDAVSEATIEAVKVRFASVAPVDALLHLASDWMLERGLGESNDTLRARILARWRTALEAGTEAGLLGQLQAWLPTGTWSTIANAEWSVAPGGRDEGHGSVAIHGDDWTSRFWVILTGHPWQDEGTWGDDGDYGDDGVWGSTMRPWHVEALRRIVSRWKAGDEVVPEVIAPGDVELWDLPTGTGEWDEAGGTWADADDAVRVEI